MPSDLPPDDRPPQQATRQDSILRQKLEESLAHHFFESCDRITRDLLTGCEWYFSTNASALRLVIHCSHTGSYWYIVSHMIDLRRRLEPYGSNTRIRVFPPAGQGTPFEIGIDEIPIE